jgi:hypothetical protein
LDAADVASVAGGSKPGCAVSPVDVGLRRAPSGLGAPSAEFVSDGGVGAGGVASLADVGLVGAPSGWRRRRLRRLAEAIQESQNLRLQPGTLQLVFETHRFGDGGLGLKFRKPRLIPLAGVIGLRRRYF